MKYIDIHSHIAYGLDDGITNKEDMIQAIQSAKKQDYKAIIMTPHITCGEHDQSYLDLIQSKFEELKAMGNDYGIDVYLGNELLLNEKVYKMILNNSFHTINQSKYVLVEANLRDSSNEVERVFDVCLNELLSKGYVPILAHLERYFKDGIDLDYAQYLIDKGCLIQVNTTSILDEGTYESDYRNAIALLDGHYVHFIASDAHRGKVNDMRVLNMEKAYDKLDKMGFDDDYLYDLMYENGKRIINNEEKEKIVCNQYKKRSIIKKLMYR